MITLKYIFQTAIQVVAMAAIVWGSVWFGWMFAMSSLESRGSLFGDGQGPVPTIEQIQQLVGCEKIDGKLGPETMAKWNRAVCDQYAAQYFKPQINTDSK